MRKILVIAAAGAALAVGGTTVALAQSGADDGTQAPTSVESTPTSASSATRLTETTSASPDTTSASPETTRSAGPTGSRTSSRPAPSTYATRGGHDDGPAHDLGDDHGGRGNDDHGRHGDDDHGRHGGEAGDDHSGRH
jgi:hypothetical protein